MNAIAPRRWMPDALALALLTLLLLPPRLLALGANFPLDIFRGVLTDEGAWAQNARQHLLFGQWVMDDHNAGLIVTPLYTMALRGIYRVIGIGLAETRLLSALSGWLTCLLVYWLGRRLAGVRVGLVAALVLGLSYFHLTQNRVGLTESFQLLFLTATILGVLLAPQRPAWALAGGVAFVCSLLSKPSAVVLGLPIALYWGVRWFRSRRAGGEGAFSWREPLLFALAAAVVLLLLGVIFVLPNLDAVSAQLTRSLRHVYTAPAAVDDVRVPFFGLDAVGLTLNEFFRQSGPLLWLVLLYAVARLLRAAKPPLDELELFCWLWLGSGLAFLALQDYQPERRFLFLMPPLALLAGLACRAGALAIPGAPSDRADRWRWVVAGAMLGGAAGFYIHPLLAGPLRRLAAHLTLGGLNYIGAASLSWGLGVIAGALLLPTIARLFPRLPRLLPALALVAAVMLVDLGRYARYASHLSWGVRDSSRALAELTADWRREDRVMVGAEAYTYALETGLFAFTIVAREKLGTLLNLDGWERFRPAIAMVYTSHEAQEAAAHGLEYWQTFRPRMMRVRGREVESRIAVFVRADLCPNCVSQPPEDLFGGDTSVRNRLTRSANHSVTRLTGSRLRHDAPAHSPPPVQSTPAIWRRRPARAGP